MKVGHSMLMLGALVAVSAVLHAVKATSNKEVVTVREFVCYDDGKLSERHVGVRVVHKTTDGWRIEYDDRTGVYYTQREGEACAMETYQQESTT